MPRNVLPRDLKRAYTRLIRAYKPEQHPEQFRRIREAYETALRYVEWYATRIESTEETATVEPVPDSASGGK